MLEKIKILLGLPVEEHLLDEKLNIILDAAKNRLKLLLGGIEVPPQMEYILVDVSVIRFNKTVRKGFLLIQLKEKAYLSRRMILQITEQISRLI